MSRLRANEQQVGDARESKAQYSTCERACVRVCVRLYLAGWQPVSQSNSQSQSVLQGLHEAR